MCVTQMQLFLESSSELSWLGITKIRLNMRRERQTEAYTSFHLKRLSSQDAIPWLSLANHVSPPWHLASERKG